MYILRILTVLVNISLVLSEAVNISLTNIDDEDLQYLKSLNRDMMNVATDGSEFFSGSGEADDDDLGNEEEGSGENSVHDIFDNDMGNNSGTYQITTIRKVTTIPPNDFPNNVSTNYPMQSDPTENYSLSITFGILSFILMIIVVKLVLIFRRQNQEGEKSCHSPQSIVGLMAMAKMECRRRERNSQPVAV